MSVAVTEAPSGFSQWNELLQLLHAAFAFQHSRIDPPTSLHAFDPTLLEAKARAETLFLALEHGEIVGCVFAKPKGTSLYVGKLAVAPLRQGQGIGHRLMAAAESLARRSGLEAMELETRIELTENHDTFYAMGFIKHSEQAHPGYKRPTSITMRKYLGPQNAEV